MADILLDMDGVLADFDAMLWERFPREHLDIDCPTKQRFRFLTDHCVSKAHVRAMREMVEAAGWFRDLPVLPGAEEGVDQLLTAGLDVWVCTKPLEANPTCASDKYAWVAKHFPALRDRVILAPDKSKVHGKVLLDDAPHPDWLERAFWQPVVYPWPWNGPGSKWDGLPRWQWGDPLMDLLCAGVE